LSVVHLHTYSAYSLLSSTILPEELAKEAKQKGFKAIAITDRNVLYGVIPFYKACLKEGIQPIIGLTADILVEEGSEKSYPFILIAKNNQGFQNLIKISSAIQTKSEKGLPLKWLKSYGKSLFVLTPGRDGEIEQLLLHDEEEKAVAKIRYYQSLFDNHSFFLSLENPSLSTNSLTEKMVNLSKQMNVPLVANDLACFLNRDDYEVWKVLRAIQQNTYITEIESNREDEQHYLKSSDEMIRIFQDYPDTLENTIKIADNCFVNIQFNRLLLPKYPLNESDPDEYLQTVCIQGLKEKKGEISEEYMSRLKYELDVIRKMKFSDYFLIVWDYVQFAKNNGITVGPGRGSAAGSLVAYSLGITSIDPIQYDLLFERFLNPQRVSMPDIDIDFTDHRRDEVIRYVAEKYGQNHVAQIITYGTFAAKAAIRDTARVFGLSNKELEQLSRSIPSRLGITLPDALKESEMLQKIYSQDHFKPIIDIAMKIEGLPRHTSTHAAGVIICGEPLTNIIPVQKGTNDEVLLTQYPMGILEELGLLKMDFLGLRNLSLIDAILQGIQFKENKKIQLEKIPLSDEKTFHLLQKGQTSGIFQLESEGMRNVLMNLKPTEFEDIVAVNALYRPGPMTNIPTYISRKHKKEVVHYIHPDLEGVLAKTYGVIVYQEQIMQIASIMAGFSLGEADLLRRAVSKKKREVLDQEREHFVKGALKKGYSEKIAHEVYDLIVRFADYGFNRSHAVAYSMISYQLAYLKAHYFLHFMAALLTSSIGNEDKTAEYIKELRKQGFHVHKPSINRSTYRYEVVEDGILFSLGAIKGVGIQALREIMNARKEKPFEDLFDFCLRVSLRVVNRKTLEHLIHAGCFDEFGKDRAVLLATLDVAIEHAQLIKPDDLQYGLLLDDGLGIKPKYVEVEPIPIEVKLQNEKQVIGMFLSEHPTFMYRELFRSINVHLIDDLPYDRRGYKIGAYLTNERNIRTKNGEAMAFMQLSDESKEVSAVAFPNTYKKFGPLIRKGGIVIATGYLEVRNGQEQFVIQDLEEIEPLVEKAKDLKLYLKINRNQSGQELVKLKRILKKHKGHTPVILYYENNRQTLQLAEEFHVNIFSNGITEIRKLLGEENVVLK